jgi:hypothetical protein
MLESGSVQVILLGPPCPPNALHIRERSLLECAAKSEGNVSCLWKPSLSTRIVLSDPALRLEVLSGSSMPAHLIEEIEERISSSPHVGWPRHLLDETYGLVPA